MRIGVVSYGLPVPGQKRGGIERVAHMLAQGLSVRGHGVTVFSHDPKPHGASYEVRDLPWKGFVNTWLGRRMTMGYLGNLMALLADYREFDVLIAHGDSLLLPLKGKPVVRVLHGSAWGEAIHATSPGRFVLQLGVHLQELLTAFLRSGTVVAVSENTRASNPFVRIVIPNGIDAGIFRPGPEDKTPHPSVIFVGALTGRKRGGFLLDVFSRIVRDSFRDAELMFVGRPGPAMAGVTYYTGIDDEHLASLYRRAWLCASPSTYEGFGLPYLEAMACGTAVLATPNPGSNEVLNGGEYGRLVPDAEFGRALVDLLTRPEERQKLAAAGLERARQLSADVMVARYESLLLELVHTHARALTA